MYALAEICLGTTTTTTGRRVFRRFTWSGNWLKAAHRLPAPQTLPRLCYYPESLAMLNKKDHYDTLIWSIWMRTFHLQKAPSEKTTTRTRKSALLAQGSLRQKD